jgi:malate dehydrogenase (oxaloacetate-decarboxylating)
MGYAKKSFKKHAEWKGKIEVVSYVQVKDRTDLSLASTLEVARPCIEI